MIKCSLCGHKGFLMDYKLGYICGECLQGIGEKFNAWKEETEQGLRKELFLKKLLTNS